MKRFCSALVFVALAGGCASTPPPASGPSARQAPAQTHAYANSAAAPTNYAAARNASPSKPPRLSVGVSDPNTQLILPWFLTDLINLVNDP
ncbi:MAG: hypothetical protein LBV73_01950 [Paraburkholderia sp.]|nr:hypothetical protein [Paraburkholderia sp.]